VSNRTVDESADVAFGPALPEQVTVALGELAGAAREGLLALACGIGLEVMDLLMEQDVTALAGPKGKHDPDRTAVRHGTEAGSVVLGGRRVPVRRPRVRAADGSAELAVGSYEVFTGTDVLGQMALERMLAGLSTRGYRHGLEPVGSQLDTAATGTSKSAVSRRFVTATRRTLEQLLSADLSQLDVAALMIDGVRFAEHLCVVALAIDYTGHKHPIGLIAGSTENARVVTDLLADLGARGLDTTRPILVVIDGSKALRKAVDVVFDQPVVQRCQFHKIRNVTAYLPKTQAHIVERKLRAAYHQPTHAKARRALLTLATTLQDQHPSAAASLREGLEETLTVHRLGVTPSLARTLRSTNAIESMIEICRVHSSNVKHWRDGTMALRWCAAGMVEARKQFRRVKGYADLPKLRDALARETRTSTAGYGDPITEAA
jgi:transposase-like protein